MSAAKRRAKRKITLLVRMDATYCRMVTRHGTEKALRFWAVAILPLVSTFRRPHLGDRMLAEVNKARRSRVRL